MISLKKYLDSQDNDSQDNDSQKNDSQKNDSQKNDSQDNDSQKNGSQERASESQSGILGRASEEADAAILSVAVAAYGAALRDMGDCGAEACAALGQELKRNMGRIADCLTSEPNREALEAVQMGTRQHLHEWGQRTAAHYRQKTAEVKGLLLVMARTAESVGERDQRCAGQISEVTTRLQTIACLEDLTEIRSSIERSAADLKTSLDRMAEEGKQAIAELRAEVSVYQVKLEEAEEFASRDALTGLHNRFWVESQIERRVSKGGPLSLAILDIDAFKTINDQHGHLAGDEMLQQFARELKSASRSTDVIGRWGGDEFILVLDCAMREAEPQIERLRAWVCGDYALQSRGGRMKLRLEASIGLAERAPGETMKDLLARADAAMYGRKAATRSKAGARR